MEILRLLAVFGTKGDISIHLLNLLTFYFQMKLDFFQSGPGEAWCCLVSFIIANRTIACELAHLWVGCHR